MFDIPKLFNLGFKAAGEFLKEYAVSPKPAGGYDLGGGVSANVSTYLTKSPEGGLFEAHRKFIDIQCVFEGTEYIGVTLTDTLKVEKPFEEDGDIAFFDGEARSWQRLEKNDFLILFPQDAHLPCTFKDKAENVTKVVIKVPV